MNLRKWIAVLMIALLTLTMFAGCKTTGYDEEEAVAGDYVEGEEYVQSGDKPMKGEPSEIIEKDDPDEEPKDEDPKDEDPKDEDPKDDEEPKDDEKPKDEDPKDDEEPKDDEDPSDDGNGEEPELSLEGTDPANALKIVAYNVRYADDGGEKDIAQRAPNFKALMDKLQPDIMALSEVVPKWVKFLEENMLGSRYAMIYKYRAEDSLEAQPLIYDQTKFGVLDSGYFWLSETPDVASKGWGSEHYRGATWAKLQVKATGKVFLYYSTHMAGSDAAVTGSAKLIYKHAVEQGGFTKHPVFLSGDFNTEPWTKGYTELVTNFWDVNDVLGFDSTYTNGGYTVGKGGTHIIDYVMCSPDNVVPTHYEVLPHIPETGGYISDHKGLYVEATLK